MHLKRYRRPTLKDALRAVREELGPDALVLSTREVTATGVRGMIGRAGNRNHSGGGTAGGAG